MPIQYTEIFKNVKKENFQLKNLMFFLIFAPNIDCWYTLEPPRQKIRKLGIPRIPQFRYIKVGFKGVYITRTCFRDEMSFMI